MSKDDRSVLSWLAFAAAVAALCVAIFGLRDNGSSSSAGGTGGGAGAATTTVNVTLKDFSFNPATITIPTAGATLHLMNGSSGNVHNIEIAQLGIKSDPIPAGGSLNVTIPATPAGTYKVICPQPGHEGNGMTATLVVSDTGGSSTASAADSHASLTASQMDALMLSQAQKFPAKTVGHGGDLMAYKTLADGTKEFDIEAKVVDWEVEPGRVVKAWTYNGVVPGPEIHVNIGDKVRVVLTNHLPQSTSLHFHGIQVPNVMDGVDPYTETPTIPGGTHTYDFVAVGPATGIYHSHHNAEQQIPDGMFGAFTVGDEPIPQVLKDKGYTHVDKKINLVLNDAGVIGLSLNGKSFPATEPYTLRVGQVMEVTYMNEGLLSHPMHLHQPMGWVIAKDGEPLLTPTPTDTILVAPGERYTVLYMAKIPGVWAWHCHILTHAETPEGMKYMVTALIVER